MSRTAFLGLVATALIAGGGQGVAAPSKAPPTAARPVTMTDLLRKELSALQMLRRQRVELRRVKMGQRSVDAELKRVYTALGEVKRRQRGLTKTVARRRAALRRRVRALYRLVRKTAHIPLLDSRRARVPRDGRDALLRIVRRDLRELHHLADEAKRLKRELDNVRRRRGQALSVLRDLARRRDRIKARVAQAKQERAGLRYRRRRHKGHSSEWNRTARALEKRIGGLAMKLRQEALTFDQRRGRLERPVPGMIVKWYGERRVAGTKVTDLSKGVEISALPNWKVRTPAPGTVRFAGPVVGFRNVVIIDHDEGYMSVVGNLDRPQVKVGDTVGRGRTIALFTRRSKAVRPSIYYELRLGGRAINPLPWLRGGLAELRKRGPRDLQRRMLKPPKPATAVARRRPRQTNATTAQRD